MKSCPQFLFDFGSPNAFLSHEAIPAIETRTGVKFEYVPILLGGIFKATNNQSPAESLAGVKNKREFHAIETQRFVKRFQVQPFVWNPFFPVNTLNLMRAAVAAQLEGVFEAYVEAAFHHMWREPKKMDDPEVAAKALSSSGHARPSLRGVSTIVSPWRRLISAVPARSPATAARIGSPSRTRNCERCPLSAVGYTE